MDRLSAISLFDRHFSDYLSSHVMLDRTRSIYRFAVDSICRFTDTPFLLIGPSEAAAYFSDLRSRKAVNGTRQVSPSTADKYLRIFRAVSSYLESQVPGYRSPFLLIRPETETSFYKESEVPLRQQVSDLLSHAKEARNSVAFLAVTLAYRLALSTSEMLFLTSADAAQDENGRYFFRITGSETSERVIPVPEDVVDVIRKCAPCFFSFPGAVLFPKKNDLYRNVSDRTIRNQISALQEDKEHPVTLQKIRSLSILELCQAGNDGASVAAFTGLDGRWLFRFEKLLFNRKAEEIEFPHIKIVS